VDPTGHNSCTPEDQKAGACTVKDGAPKPTPDLQNPVRPDEGGVNLTSNWGANQWNYPQFPNHWGVDLATDSGDIGADIVAATGGKVVYAGIDPRTDPNGENAFVRSGFGYVAVVLSSDGTLTFYTHLADKPSVSVGDNLQSEALIGRMGNSGYSDGGHLHFEMWKGLDPAKFGPGSKAADWWTLRPSGTPESNPKNVNPCSMYGGIIGCTTANGVSP
jgi:murein DD-endopeptidase MepM/ murein hydrolase activator NlpD